MLNPRKSKPSSPESSARVQKHQTLRLSLFDPSLPELELGGKSTGSCSGRALCGCTARVRETDDDGFVISMPSCHQNSECMQENRVLFALLDDVQRSSFLTTVLPHEGPAGDGDRVVRLSHPESIKSCQRRGNFRAKVFPHRHCIVYGWPIRSVSQADAAVEAFVRGLAWKDERLPSTSRDHPGRSVVMDMSGRGAGLSFGITPEFPAPAPQEMMLLRCHLDPAERPLVCPVRVCWVRPMSDRVVRVGVEMMLKAFPRLESLIDNQVGAWLAELERETLRSKTVEVRGDAG